MSQEPWNDEIYKSEEKSRKNKSASSGVSTKIFTVLAVLFLIIVAAITVVAIYLSGGGSNTNSTEEFYNTSNANAANQNTTVASAQATEASTSAQEATTEASAEASAQEGETLTVQAGEGVAAIAARAGISIAELERLNPEKMTTGSWLAHPGDVVRIK